LQSQLDHAEQRLALLYQEYIQSDKERGGLLDLLRQYQASAQRAIILHRLKGGDDTDVSQSLVFNSDKIDQFNLAAIDNTFQLLTARIEHLERERVLIIIRYSRLIVYRMSLEQH
jgi:hypothetical protein